MVASVPKGLELKFHMLGRLVDACGDPAVKERYQQMLRAKASIAADVTELKRMRAQLQRMVDLELDPIRRDIAETSLKSFDDFVAGAELVAAA